jgi:alpha-D-ribose 1-methylphosphonate 5-triphosphate synthase subunit PhnH
MTIVESGFIDPVIDAQKAFRGVLNAIARPGNAVHIDVDVKSAASLLGVSPAALASLLALVDFDTAVWLDCSGADDLRAYLRFHTGARFASGRGDADFAYIGDASRVPLLSSFQQGTAASPEGSTIVIVDVPDFEGETSVILDGPGCKEPVMFSPTSFTVDLWVDVAMNHQQFPAGVDLLVCAGEQMVGIPRSTRIGVLDASRAANPEHSNSEHVGA